MVQLNRRAGEIVAQVTGAEAGLVTAGASAALTLQAAVCMTGANEAVAAQLPDTTGLKDEIVIQKAHRNRYDGAYRLAGAKLVEIGVARTTAVWELENALTDRTAAVAYVLAPFLRQPLPLRTVTEIAHKRGIPVIVDAAAELPPVGNLKRFIADGADLVCFSGGKGIGGPQSSGMLFGRRDLIEAAWFHSLNYDSPHAGIGRPMKASKEAIVGLLTALELFLARDHTADWQLWRRRAEHVAAKLAGIPGLRLAVEEEFRQGPQAVIYFTPEWKGPPPSKVVARLRNGDPSIHIGSGGFVGEIYVVALTLQDGEELIVADRLRSALLEA
jgi:L-seryl-tRNA(Ser) seleniumtransferase